MTKTTDPHKESRAKTEEKIKNNENMQHMCKGGRQVTFVHFYFVT